MTSDPQALIEAGFQEDAAVAICRLGKPFSAGAGVSLFRPGDVCPGFVALTDGVIRVALVAQSGRAATLYRVSPGEMCLQTFQRLMDGQAYSAEGIVETPVKGVIVPPEAFNRLMAESSAFRDLVMHQVAERFDLIVRSFEDTAFRPLETRLAGALLRLAENGAAHATHAELAAEIGSSREVVSRQMQRWAADDLVRAARGSIEILQPEKLARIADAAD